MATEIKGARDALEKILWCLNWMSENTGDQSTKDHLVKPIELAQAALALPRRNCEAGTPEEQAKRFHEFCFGAKCAECSAHYTPEHETEAKLYGRAYCVTKWAQMPYEADAQKGGAE